MEKSTQKLIEVVSKAAHEHKTETKICHKKATMEKKAVAMVRMELSINDYMDMLDARAQEFRGEELPLRDELRDYFIGIENVPEPMIFVDNYLINGEFVEKGEFTPDGNYSGLYEQYNGDWEKMCDNEAVIYNEEMACLRLG